jgi:hypothetical protein
LEEMRRVEGWERYLMERRVAVVIIGFRESQLVFGLVVTPMDHPSGIRSGANPTCEYDNISGGGFCDSVSIWDAGIELMSISVVGHWRDPLGVTRGVSMYGSDSWEYPN